MANDAALDALHDLFGEFWTGDVTKHPKYAEYCAQYRQGIEDGRAGHYVRADIRESLQHHRDDGAQKLATQKGW